MTKPGVADGFANFGDRNVSLPGEHAREKNGACWANADTGTKTVLGRGRGRERHWSDRVEANPDIGEYGPTTTLFVSGDVPDME